LPERSSSRAFRPAVSFARLLLLASAFGECPEIGFRQGIPVLRHGAGVAPFAGQAWFDVVRYRTLLRHDAGIALARRSISLDTDIQDRLVRP